MAGHAPYLMPDGRPLGQFLQDSNLEHRSRCNRKTKRGKDGKAAHLNGFTSSRVYTVSKPAPLSEVEQRELSEVVKLGRERRRRYLNDRLLRDMAGPLTAHAMAALYQPPPYGETEHMTALQEALLPDNLHLWQLFANIDMDKERRVLQKWEEHVRQLRAAGPAGSSPAAEPSATLTALRSWARVSRKAREALKRAAPAMVELLELPLLRFLSQGQGDGEQELLLHLEDSFQRLLAHGLAEFHGLSSHSRDAGANGASERVTVVRRSNGVTIAAPEITCADVLLALEDHPVGGVTPTVLQEYIAAHHPPASPTTAMVSAEYVVV